MRSVSVPDTCPKGQPDRSRRSVRLQAADRGRIITVDERVRSIRRWSFDLDAERSRRSEVRAVEAGLMHRLGRDAMETWQSIHEEDASGRLRSQSVPSIPSSHQCHSRQPGESCLVARLTHANGSGDIVDDSSHPRLTTTDQKVGSANSLRARRVCRDQSG
jgi:hypothetical protein